MQTVKQSDHRFLSESFKQDIPQSLTPSKSRFIGSILVVAGTTVGAGMLALPMTSSRVGFINSTLLLVAMWAFTCFTALLTLEINLRFGGGYSISYLAGKVFGRFGKWIASLSMGLLFYALLSAYATGGASFLKEGFESILGLHFPFSVMALIFITMLGFFVYSSTRYVDYANRLLLFFKMGIFFSLIYFLIPFIQTKCLTTTVGEYNALWLAIPIFFTSFGFHGSIPTLINYVGPNPIYLRKVIIIGSLAPLVIYILWQTVTLGALPPSTPGIVNAEEQNVAFFIRNLNEVTQRSTIGSFSNIFAFFGVSTSFLGVAIGLFDYLAESLKKSNNSIHRLQTALLTFLPPLFFALFYPNGFIIALGYAAIALSVLAVLLPAAIAYKLRQSNRITMYKVIGGNITLIFIFLCGLSIILAALHN